MRNEKYKQDIIPGIVLMIFSIGYLAMIPSIVELKGMGSTPLTNRFVPYLWGGALLVLSVWILVRGIIQLFFTGIERQPFGLLSADSRSL